jgi:predicted nucleic acid-binding protein
VIHLDTNALIALPRWLKMGHQLIHRVSRGGKVAVSAIVWYEYQNGPVQLSESRLVEDFIEQRIEPIEAVHAELAAKLFNQTGRRRVLRMDALVAAAAIRSDAELLTADSKDFTVFTSAGLKLFA